MFNNDDSELFSGSSGGLILVWDLTTGKGIINIKKVKLNLQGHSTNVLSMSLCGQNTLLSGALDGKMKMWDLRQKNPAWTIKAHMSLINCLTISPNNRIIASGSEDNYVKV